MVSEVLSFSLVLLAAFGILLLCRRLVWWWLGMDRVIEALEAIGQSQQVQEQAQESLVAATLSMKESVTEVGLACVQLEQQLKRADEGLEKVMESTFTIRDVQIQTREDMVALIEVLEKRVDSGSL